MQWRGTSKFTFTPLETVTVAGPRRQIDYFCQPFYEKEKREKPQQGDVDQV